MKMESSALQFSPQVMALATPGESEFTKAAEGVSNLGKVFIDEQARQEASKLNALKMREAEVSIQGKEFDNSIAGEKWSTEKATKQSEQAKNLWESKVKKHDYETKVKAEEESDTTKQISGMIDNSLLQNDQGKLDLAKVEEGRKLWKSKPEWAGKEHIVDAVFNTKVKQLQDVEENNLKNAKTQAEAYKISEEGKVVAPKAQSEIAKNQSVVLKNQAGARLDNVNADLAPAKIAAYTRQVNAQLEALGMKGKDLTKERQKIVADDKLQFMVPEWDSYGDAERRVIINRFVTSGDLPSESKEVMVKKGWFSDDTRLDPVYPKPAAPKPSATKPAAQEKATTKVVKTTTSGPVEGTVIRNPSTGQTMKLQGGKWVEVK